MNETVERRVVIDTIQSRGGKTSIEELTLQAGIDAALDGDTVLVADGEYTGEETSGKWISSDPEEIQQDKRSLVLDKKYAWVVELK